MPEVIAGWDFNDGTVVASAGVGASDMSAVGLSALGNPATSGFAMLVTGFPSATAGNATSGVAAASAVMGARALALGAPLPAPFAASLNATAALLGRELRQGVVGATELEGAHALEVFGLEVHLGRGQAVEGVGTKHRRAVGDTVQALRGSGDVGPADGQLSHG
jgi:hypothetical protein